MSNSSAFRRGLALLAAAGLVAAPTFVLTAQAAPTCFGKPVTIMGTSGDDRLEGLPDVSDVIHGGGGDDVVYGGDFYGNGDAPDLLCGGRGDDRVIGSPGDDMLRGGPGDDVVNGENGADLELGDSGRDRVGQGSFADADSADDVMRGGPGPDRLIGGWGSDEMYGGSGSDELHDIECDGPTLLVGGPGRDHLESWTSSFEGGTEPCGVVSDVVRGGAGRDSAVVDSPDTVTGVESLDRVGP